MPELEALRAVFRHGKESSILAAVGLVLLAGSIGWFWIPDSSSVAVILGFVAAPLLVLGWIAWVGASFAFFVDAHGGESARLAIAWPCLPALAMWAAIALVGLAPVNGSALLAGLFALWLPMGPAIAKQSWRGFRPRFPVRFYPAGALMIATGVYLPMWLLNWHPELGGVATQTASLALRFIVAYLIAVAAWLAVASLSACTIKTPRTEALASPPSP